MTTTPKVSVIIPNYNHAKFLKERIDSVLNQTYRDFEIILLDDKSSDNSKEIIQSYESEPLISHTIFNEENSGSTFKQWQKGFNIARGEYIWIAESDDVADPTFLEKIMGALLQDKNIVLGFSDLDFIDQDGALLDWEVPTHILSKNPENGKEFILNNMLFGNSIYNASGVVFRKDTLSKISTEYKSFKGAGDYLFWIEIIKLGLVYKVPQTLNHFRQHNSKVTPGSVSSGTNFIEGHKIFRRLLELNLISNSKKDIVIGYWLRRLNQSKKLITDKSVYRKCKEMWESESRVGSFSQIFYIIYKIFLKTKNYL